VEVTFDSTGLAAGTYESFICINSNDTNTPLYAVPVSMEVCSAPVATTDAAISDVGGDVQITWSATAGSDHYEIWSSADPYFVPSGTCVAPGGGLTCHTEVNSPHVDNYNGGIGDTGTNYYYYVMAVNACGTATSSATSEHVAEFDFAVIPGTP
jgi:hypothetical protein